MGKKKSKRGGHLEKLNAVHPRLERESSDDERDDDFRFEEHSSTSSCGSEADGASDMDADC